MQNKFDYAVVLHSCISAFGTLSCQLALFNLCFMKLFCFNSFGKYQYLPNISVLYQVSRFDEWLVVSEQWAYSISYWESYRQLSGGEFCDLGNLGICDSSIIIGRFFSWGEKFLGWITLRGFDWILMWISFYVSCFLFYNSILHVKMFWGKCPGKFSPVSHFRRKKILRKEMFSERSEND